LQREVYDKLHIVLGVVNDKSLDNILPLFPKNAIYYFCKPDIPRGKNVEELKDIATKFGLNGEAFSSVMNAYQKALESAKLNDMVFAGGSTFVVAELPL